MMTPTRGVTPRRPTARGVPESTDTLPARLPGKIAAGGARAYVVFSAGGRSVRRL